MDESPVDEAAGPAPIVPVPTDDGRATRRPTDAEPTTPGATVDELVIGDEPGDWRALGFMVDGDVCRIGTVAVRLVGREEGRGLLGWSLRGVAGAELDGLPTTVSQSERPDPALPHPNGVVSIDHVVAFSPDLDRTIAALKAAGMDLRRIREEPTPAGAPRQAFFRLGEVILEVVQQPADQIPGFDPTRPARLWGLALRVEDLDDCAAYLGDRLGEVRDAIQPGRRIATLRREAGLGLAVAFMSPDPKHPRRDVRSRVGQ